MSAVAELQSVTEEFRTKGQIARRLRIRMSGTRKGSNNRPRPVEQIEKLTVPAEYESCSEAQLLTLEAEVEQLEKAVVAADKAAAKEMAETQQVLLAEASKELYGSKSDEELSVAARDLECQIDALREARTILQFEIGRRSSMKKLQAKLGELTDLEKQRLSQMLTAEHTQAEAVVHEPGK